MDFYHEPRAKKAETYIKIGKLYGEVALLVADNDGDMNIIPFKNVTNLHSYQKDGKWITRVNFTQGTSSADVYGNWSEKIGELFDDISS